MPVLVRKAQIGQQLDFGLVQYLRDMRDRELKLSARVRQDLRTEAPSGWTKTVRILAPTCPEHQFLEHAE